MSDYPTVFLSYPSLDDRGDEIANALRMSGATVLRYDAGADDPIDALEDALDRCEVFVPLISKESLESPFLAYEVGFILREVALGRTRIIPVLLDDIGGKPLPHGLGRFQAPDGRGKGIAEIVDAVLAELARAAADRVSV